MVTSRTYAERITVILDYLKSQKVKQYKVEERLNYTSLSKAKNYVRYPQMIIEKKTREELFHELLVEFGLVYDEITESVVKTGEVISNRRDNAILYYIMYYYAFARATVGKAMVRILNNYRVIMDYELDEHWEGTYEVIENYSFLMMEKIGGVTPVKKLICLFSGTKRTGRPILLGTYSTIKRDGIPAAGKILFERVYDEESLEKMIRKDVDPRITYYLFNAVWVTDTFTPNTLNDISKTYQHIKRFASDYYLFYPRANKELIRAALKCEDNSVALLNINTVNFYGHFGPIDNHTLKFEFSANIGISDLFTDTLILFVNTSKSKFEPFYICYGLSNAPEIQNNSFTSMMIEQELFDNTEAGTYDKTLSIIQDLNSILSI
ncbi:MAG: hypothetical protein WAL29_11025 [Bacteroidales bacterium]